MIRIVIFLVLFGFVAFPPDILDKKLSQPIEEMSVGDVLRNLGDQTLENQMANRAIKGVSEQAGESIVMKGYGIKPNGSRGKRVSKHFECIACHNIVREDPDLTKSDPTVRLTYAKENSIPFLQGTTLYGLINRTSFYNGDYEKKYGDLVDVARNDIREAIQVCATECSQGRKLKDWEVESVLAYLETIQLKISDLNLDTEESNAIQLAVEGSGDSNHAAELIKSKYLSGSPAHFIDPPPNRVEGNDLSGNTESGKLIYELSCLHCHQNKRYSFLKLDNSKNTFKFLANHVPKYTRHSIYQVGRYGTSPLTLKKAYMPQYTLEKMTRQQMEDLRAYIEMKAE